MIIGIPRENWREERRVALTPAGVNTLIAAQHQVIVQFDAGAGSGFLREDYERAGAVVAFSAEEVFSRSDLIAKVMPPTEQECGWIRAETILFSSVQMGVANPDVHRSLMNLGVSAVGYELIEDENHNLPVLRAISEIAGKLLPQIAGRFLESTYGGRGICLSGIAGIPAANVVIVGAGTAGCAAAKAFVGCGASVMVMDSDLNRLRAVGNLAIGNINTALATPYNLSRAVEFADVIVGAVLIHGRRSPNVITENMVRKMRQGSVIIDLSIDQGGCVETSRPTSPSDPVFEKHGVIHYCVPNIASTVARTASHALNNVVVPFVEEVACAGLEPALSDPVLKRGIYLYRGQLMNAELATMLGLGATDWRRVQYAGVER